MISAEIYQTTRMRMFLFRRSSSSSSTKLATKKSERDEQKHSVESGRKHRVKDAHRPHDEMVDKRTTRSWIQRGETNEQPEGEKERETNKGEKHSAFKIKCKLTGNDPQSGKV